MRNILNSLAVPGFVGVTLAAGVAGCCFGGGSGVPITPPPPGPGTPPAIVAPPPAVGAQAITLGAGFAPDPTTAVVTAGGPVEASAMGAAGGCRGSYPVAAQITLTTTAALPSLRIVGRATEDTTMAVRFPDGHVVCSDDEGGYPNPAIDIPNAAAGAYQVYIGSYSAMGQGVPTTVAFTTNMMLQGAQVP